MNLDELAELLMGRLEAAKPRALLLGSLKDDHNYIYVNEKPYEAIVIGRLPPGDLLQMPNNAVCEALLEGMPVYLHPQKYETAHARLLIRALASAEQRLKQLGVRPVQTGALITKAAAEELRRQGRTPPPGSRLTPLAREILEGNTP